MRPELTFDGLQDFYDDVPDIWNDIYAELNNYYHEED